MMRNFLIFTLSIAASLCFSCDNMVEKNDDFTEDMEEKISMVQSEMQAIVATGDSIDAKLERVMTLKNLPAADTTADELTEIENAYMVLKRKQDNLETAFAGVVNEYSDLLKSYREDAMTREEATAGMKRISERPVTLMENHEALLDDLVDVEKELRKLETYFEEGKQQRV